MSTRECRRRDEHGCNSRPSSRLAYTPLYTTVSDFGKYRPLNCPPWPFRPLRWTSRAQVYTTQCGLTKRNPCEYNDAVGLRVKFGKRVRNLQRPA